MGFGGLSTNLVLPPPWISQYRPRPSAVVATPEESGSRARVPVSGQLTSGPRLEDEVERRLRAPAEAGEAAAHDHVADARPARLGSEREPDLLGQGGRRAQQR